MVLELALVGVMPNLLRLDCNNLTKLASLLEARDVTMLVCENMYALGIARLNTPQHDPTLAFEVFHLPKQLRHRKPEVERRQCFFHYALEIETFKVRLHELRDLLCLLCLVSGFEFPGASVNENFLKCQGCLDLIVVTHVTIDFPALAID